MKISSLEHQLASYAVKSNESRGRQYKEALSPHRNEFQRDRDRVVHSAAFRKLEHKTQVFITDADYDYGEHGVNHALSNLQSPLKIGFRTRLTHSLEVSQIARTIANSLGLNVNLTEAIALAHDIGHTPFGHAGQYALNQCMREFGGFEHNFQALRIVDHLEEKYACFNGLNLTFECREGILKHCGQEQLGKLIDDHDERLAQRFINRHQPSLEAQVANLADAIAYNSHDVDDGLRMELLQLSDLNDIALFISCAQEVDKEWPQLGKSRFIHECVRRLVDRQVRDLIAHSRKLILRYKPADVDSVRKMSVPLISFSDDMLRMHKKLKQGLFERLYSHPLILDMSEHGKTVVKTLFYHYLENINQFNNTFGKSLSRGKDAITMYDNAREVADIVAGLTDQQALYLFKQLKSSSNI